MANNIHDYTTEQLKDYHNRAVRPLGKRITDLEGKATAPIKVNISADVDNQLEERTDGLYVPKPADTDVTITQQNGYVELDSTNGSHGEVYDGKTPEIKANSNGVLTWWIDNVDTTYPVTGYTPEINDYSKEIPLLDINGNPILDSNGVPMTDTIEYKAWYINGNPILDASGEPIIAEGSQGVNWTIEKAYDPTSKTSQLFWFRDGIQTPYIAIPDLSASVDGYWVINGIKTSILMRGDKGDKGDTGSGFFVDRRYVSIADMIGDVTPTKDSNFVLVEDSINNISNLYLRQSSFVVDVAGGEIVGQPNYDGYIFWGSKMGVSTVQGKSAYETWLEINGYTSSTHTERDFIDSLKGADGKDGIKIMPLTRAQYNALSNDASGKFNPLIIYHLTDVLEQDINDFMLMSTAYNYMDNTISKLIPTIGSDGFWYIGGVKTSYKATPNDGIDGKDGKDGIVIEEVTKSVYSQMSQAEKTNPMKIYHLDDDNEIQPVYSQAQVDAMIDAIDVRLKAGGL